MKTTFALLAFAGTAFAHNIVTHFHINGVSDNSCVRQATSTNPIIDIQSDDMACNSVKGLASNKCVVKPGDAIGFEWRTDPNIAPADYPLKDGTIPVGVTDDSHKGPCAIYMKKVTDSSTASGPGDGWFKVSEDGLDSNGVFCTDRLREANAPQPGVVPSGIEPGDYLLRAEMLTLNNAGPASLGGEEQPQFYVGCVQVTVEGSSGTNPDTVSIPGYLTMSSPGLIYDIWNSPNGKFSDYTVPGPAPMAGSGSGSGSGSPAASSKPATGASSASQPAATKTTPVSAPAPTENAPTEDTPPAGTPSESGDSEAPVYSSPKPTSVEVPATTATPDVNPPRTRTPVYTVTTATTLITITATTNTFSPEETGSSDETYGDDAEPTHTHGHGRHRGGRAHRAHRREAL